MAKSTVEKAEQAKQLPLDKYPTDNLHNLRHDKHGRELLDPVPMQPPVNYTRPPSLIETVREQIRAHHRLAADAELDSEEEADDFEMDDDANDPRSRYENDFEPSLKAIRENRAQIDAYMEELAAVEMRPPAGGPPASLPSAPQASPPAVHPEPTPPPSGGSARSAPGETPPSPPPTRRLW